MMRASLIFLLCAVLTSPFAAAQSERRAGPARRYIVQTVPSPDVQGLAQGLAQRFNGLVGHVYSEAVSGFSVELPSDWAARELLSRPGVLRVEADIMVYAVAQTLPTGINRIDVDQHPGLKIDGLDDRIDVDIAIIDTGVDIDHPDLRVAGGRRFYTSGGRSYQDNRYDDDNGHGTHCAGIAAAIDNTAGAVGVAPGARLWSVRVLNAQGSGYLSDVIAGIDWVTARAGTIEVANLSLAATGKSDILRTAIQKSVAAGVVYMAAAGNDGRDIFGPDGVFNTSDDVIPAAYPEVGTISAMADFDGKPGGTGPTTGGRPDDSFADFSNYSTQVKPGSQVNSPGAGIDLVMPGVNIYSCYRGGIYKTLSGTSMAAPHATGLAALYIAEHGRAASAAGVYAIRQALIDAGMNQTSDKRLALPGSEPDGYPENLGWAGAAVTAADAAPVVTIIQPAEGSTLAGTVTVRISASDAEDAASSLTVQVRIDSAEARTAAYDAGSGYHELTWDTTSLADGQHTLSAYATDTTNNTSDTAQVAVAVKNTDAAPTAAIVNPQNAGTVSGSVTIQVQAADDRDTAGSLAVVVSVAGAAAQTAVYNWVTGYYELAWDTASSADGSCTIDAHATDSGSHTTNAARITVTINNHPTTLPTVHVASVSVTTVPYWGTWQRVRAQVTIVDAAGAPVQGATVSGTFSGDVTSRKTGSTNAAGQVTFDVTWWRSTQPRATFCVDDVTHDAFTYEPTDNQQTCGSNY